MNSNSDNHFLQWALPKLEYRWKGFRRPKKQIIKRIRHRMQDLQLVGGYDEYREYLEKHEEEWVILDRLLNVTISRFFRNRQFWDFIRDEILPDLLGKHSDTPVEIWSAGCCNGEEPYSCTILIEQLRQQKSAIRQVAVLASDRKPEVLQRAGEGKYPAGALKELTEGEIEQFFHKTDDDEDQYLINRQLARYVTFEHRDIKQTLPDKEFDLIFCRNLVFTYFSKESQEQFLMRIKSRLKQPGYLAVGSNETLPSGVAWLQRATNTHPLYKRAG